jgi:hypothetical protein
VVPLLDDKRFRRAKAVAARQVNEAVADTYARVVIYLYEWLVHLGLFDDVEVGEILDNVLLTFKTHATKAVLTVADGRYVTWTGYERWYDVLRDETEFEMPAPAVTLITCNVAALIVGKEERLAVLAGGTDGPASTQPDGVRRGG